MKNLEFNNEKVLFAYQNSEYYVAIKPLCTALGISHKHQFEVIKADSILGPEYRNYGIQLEGQKRKFLCLPEYLVYGWLIQVNSVEPKFEEFKNQCHKILHEYFKGTVLGRKSLITQKASLISDNQKVEIKLSLNTDFRKWQENAKKIEKINSLLRNQDKTSVQESMGLFGNIIE
jgi:hypothetical protein